MGGVFMVLNPNFRCHRKLCLNVILILALACVTSLTPNGVSLVKPEDGIAKAQTGEESASITLRLAHSVTLDHPTHTASLEVARDICARTGGKIRMDVFGNMQFGQEIDLVKLVIKGKLDFAIVSTGPLPTYNPAVGILDLPYLFATNQLAYQAWDGEPGQAVLRLFKDSGFEGVCYWENGLRSLTTNDHPVMRPEDLRNLHLRVMQNPIYISFFTKLGAIPTPLPWGEVVPSLQSGVITAQENPIPVIYLSHLEKYQRYLNLTQHTYNPHLVLASPYLAAKLSHDEIVAIYSMFQNARIRQRRRVTDQSVQYLEILKSNGMKIIKPDLTEFKKVGREFSREAILNFPAQIRSLFERYLR
jgi:tripartite ATP-independent transporter DctP family solute receptor